jgi:spore maturation protein CgeB
MPKQNITPEEMTAVCGRMVACRAANPATVLALLDELEKAQAQSSKWCEAFHKAVSVGARYEERIAELEAREVNLPKYCVAKVMLLSGFDRQYAEGWCAGNDNAIHEIRAAGISIKGSE